MDEFVLRALIGALLLAAMLGPLGAFTVWRQMAYFGDTIAHSALLGVAVALLTGGALPMTLCIFAVAVLVALLLSRFARDARFHADTLLGILAHGTLAFGVLLVALSRNIRVDINAYLFGDILAISWNDVMVLAGLALVILALLRWQWKPLLMVTIDPAIAQVEGVKVARSQQLLTLMLAAVIAVSIKLTGVLLITALLIMPAAAARYLARSPLQMALWGSVLGCAAVVSGLFASLKIDAPSGPMMVVMAAVIFVGCSFWKRA
jgi:zinc transport system permease protein